MIACDYPLPQVDMQTSKVESIGNIKIEMMTGFIVEAKDNQYNGYSDGAIKVEECIKKEY